MKKRFGYALLSVAAGLLLTASPLYANTAAAKQKYANTKADGGPGEAGAAAFFEGPSQAVVKIPFMFAVDGKVLPSGEYALSHEGDNLSLLRISSVNGSHQAIVPTVSEGGINSWSDARLVFNDFSGVEVLSAVALPGDEVRSISTSRRTLERDVQAMALVRFRTESAKSNAGGHTR
jgi:hypothetical protein